MFTSYQWVLNQSCHFRIDWVGKITASLLKEEKKRNITNKQKEMRIRLRCVRAMQLQLLLLVYVSIERKEKRCCPSNPTCWQTGMVRRKKIIKKSMFCNGKAQLLSQHVTLEGVRRVFSFAIQTRRPQKNQENDLIESCRHHSNYFFIIFFCLKYPKKKSLFYCTNWKLFYSLY